MLFATIATKITPPTAFANDARKFVSVKFLQDRYDVSRETIYKYMRDYNFPKQIKLTPGAARWNLEEVEAWELSRQQ